MSSFAPASFPIAAALIAGGQSRRMGQDKALLNWQGKRLWETQLAKLQELQPTRLLLSCRREQNINASDVELLFDPPTSEGPLPALARCLELAKMPVLALAVDMPHISSALLRSLIEMSPNAERGVIYHGTHGYEPLCALYPVTLLPLLHEAMTQGNFRFQSLVQQAVEKELLTVLPMAPEMEMFFFNINTPADLSTVNATRNITIQRLYREQAFVTMSDAVATEEPLEIRVEGRSIAVIMRTPGHDEELAAGFLLSEGVVHQASDLFEISVCPSTSQGGGNVVDVLLSGVQVNWDSLTRHVFASSSCGICGKTSMDAVFQSFPKAQDGSNVTANVLRSLPEKLRRAQSAFEKTGGLHASALFDQEGNIVVLREDVGRHNALDKVLGFALRENMLPLSQHLLMVSGRVSFEIMQKALAGGIGLVAAISAPSSLAVDFAIESGQTLVGFMREDRMNVYAHPERIHEI